MTVFDPAEAPVFTVIRHTSPTGRFTGPWFLLKERPNLWVPTGVETYHFSDAELRERIRTGSVADVTVVSSPPEG